MDDNLFYDAKTGVKAPNRVQNLLDNSKFMKGIEKALYYLGEKR